MTSKKRNIIATGGIILIIVIIALVFILPRLNFDTSMGNDISSVTNTPSASTFDPDKDIEQQIAEEMQEVFLIYSDYGLTYDVEARYLYYKDNLVKMFVDEYLDLSYEQANGTVTVVATRDNEGNLTGLNAK